MTGIHPTGFADVTGTVSGPGPGGVKTVSGPNLSGVWVPHGTPAPQQAPAPSGTSGGSTTTVIIINNNNSDEECCCEDDGNQASFNFNAMLNVGGAPPMGAPTGNGNGGPLRFIFHNPDGTTTEFPFSVSREQAMNAVTSLTKPGMNMFENSKAAAAEAYARGMFG